jgi:tetratricopeptide (TPR) repeat protein
MKRQLLILIGMLFVLPVHAAGPDAAISQLQHEWAVVKYRTPEDKQEAAFTRLEEQAAAAVQAHPGRAEPLVWQAIILSTHAGAKGGFGALSLVKQARGLLEQAEKIDPDALQGSVYTSLGSLYYQVPGWPIGFGDDDKAESYLKKALSINPDGIDPNYFYGDFLLDQGRYAEARDYLNKALAAPARSDRPLADKGRRAEIRKVLDKVRAELKNQES